jgi:flagellar biosynthesis/type III secretory pathway protein FliH
MFKTGSPVLQEVVDELTRRATQKAVREAKREAKREGIREGKREGIREGIREGKREGEREAAESLLSTVLVARFGTEAEGLKAELKSIRDDRLKKLVKLAATCPDLDSFRKELAPRRGKGGT